VTAPDGISVVIPTGGAARLKLLAATLASLRRCAGVAQIILSEAGDRPHALDLARQWDADHLFTFAPGPFDRAAARNAGSRLARGDTIMWCDGDLLFGPDFVMRAREELEASGFDYLAPFSRIDYLSAAQSDAVIAGRLAPADCTPIRVLGPLHHGAPGGIGLVRAAFLARHGGMPGFKGWGLEDDAWVHKASVLGRIGATARADQRVWHLFHADSGSHSVAAGLAAKRRNASYAQNAAVFAQMQTIRDPDTWRAHFPPPAFAPTPWPAENSIVFTATGARARARAQRWAARIAAEYGVDVPVTDAAEAGRCDMLVAFCDKTAAQCPEQASIVVTDGGAPGHTHATVLARNIADVTHLRAEGRAVWHRPWGENGADDPIALIQAMSHVLVSPRTWRVRIALDRTRIAPPAFDRPRFWYFGLHDAGEVELLRQDLNGAELQRATAPSDSPIVIERELRAIRPPARWTVWPADRTGRWLDKLSGAIDGEALMQEVRA